MSVRHFTAASSEKIVCSLGATNFVMGPGTIAAVVRPTTLAVQAVFTCGATNAVSYMFRAPATVGGLLGLATNNTNASSLTALTVNKWYLCAASKASGTAAPRFHIWDYAAGGPWVHENSGTTLGDSTAGLTRCSIGCTPAGAGFFDGDIAAIGAWNVVLTDLQVESLLLFLPAVSKGLWRLNQDVTSETVQDLSGLGANQASIVGTSVTAVTQPVGMFNVAPPKPYEPRVGVYGVQAMNRATNF